MLWLLCYLFFRGQPSNAFCSHLMKNWTPSTLLSPYAAANPQHSRGLSFAVKWRWLRHITQEQCLSPYAGTVLVISVNLLRPVSQYIIIMSPGSVMAIGWLSGEMERSCCEDSRVEISFLFFQPVIFHSVFCPFFLVETPAPPFAWIQKLTFRAKQHSQQQFYFFIIVLQSGLRVGIVRGTVYNTPVQYFLKVKWLKQSIPVQ